MISVMRTPNLSATTTTSPGYQIAVDQDIQRFARQAIQRDNRSRDRRSSSLIVILVRPSSTVSFTGISRIRSISCRLPSASWASSDLNTPSVVALDFSDDCCSLSASAHRSSTDSFPAPDGCLDHSLGCSSLRAFKIGLIKCSTRRAYCPFKVPYWLVSTGTPSTWAIMRSGLSIGKTSPAAA